MTFARAASWMRAEASLLVQGPLEGDALEARLAACRGCHRFERAEGKVGFCTACGCGRSARAELSVKARMPAATCPLDRWPREPKGGKDAGDEGPQA